MTRQKVQASPQLHGESAHDSVEGGCSANRPLFAVKSVHRLYHKESAHT